MGDGYDQHFGLRERAFDPAHGRAPDGLPAHLGPEEVEAYLVERLCTAGWQGAPVLDLGLAPLLFEATNGERAAIDRAMTALLEDAAREGRDVIDGAGLAAWLDSEPALLAEGLSEAQLDAIESAFADHDRKLAGLRRELAELRERSAGPSTPEGVEGRLGSLEARLDQQEQVLRHVLDRLIAFFEESRA